MLYQCITHHALHLLHTHDNHSLQQFCSDNNQGCSPKKEVGGRLKQDLDKDV